jgi:hypothetical protein
MFVCYWTVLSLVASNYPLKILPGEIIELGVQGSCHLCSLDLSLLFVKLVLFLETVLTKANSLSLESK